MKVIFRRTLEESLRIPAIIISILAGVLAGVALGRTANYNTIPAFSYYMNALLIRQHMAVFFLINGVVLMTMISAISSGLIAGEVHEGTLRILITKLRSGISVIRNDSNAVLQFIRRTVELHCETQGRCLTAVTGHNDHNPGLTDSIQDRNGIRLSRDESDPVTG